MRSRVVLVVLVVAGAACAAAGLAQAGSSDKRYLVSDCQEPHFRPHRVIVACGDGNFYVNHIDWSDWDGKVSHGEGTAHLNDCNPYCAAGHFHKYHVKVRASKVRDCQGKRTYLNFRWTYTDKRPDGVERSDRTSFAYAC